MCESKKGMSANQLKRTLGIGSYKTAWHLCHRIRSAMVEANPAMLSGVVEADETYVGGKLRFPDPRDARHHRFDNKSVVLGAIQRGGKLRLRMVPKAGKREIHGFLHSVVEPDAELFTDSSRIYDKYPGIHEKVDHRAEEWVRGDVHTNSIESAWSLFDRAVIGSYHKLSKKHLPAYLQEFEFRFNNRENPYLFRDTLRALVNADALPYADLTANPR
jgi:transposase-like protein